MLTNPPKGEEITLQQSPNEEKRPWYETLELTWLNSNSLMEYSPKYSVPPVYLSDFVDSDGCPVGVESAQHAHLYRKWCALTLLCCAVVSVCARTLEHFSFCVVSVETRFMYEHTFYHTLCVFVPFVINLDITFVCFK